MFSKLLLLMLLAGLVLAQEDSVKQSWLERYGLTQQWMQEQESPLIYKADGRLYAQRRGDKMAPKLIIDSVNFFDGVAVFALNTDRGRNKTRLSARSEDDIHVLSVYDTDIDSTVVSRTLDTVRVYSASAANNTRRQIQLMVQ